MQPEYLHTVLYKWYDRHARVLPWRETNDPYCIWLSEIILQQTRVAQGMAYYLRFIDTYPTVYALAAADEKDVMRLWQGLGYYSRARNLHAAAQRMAEEGGVPTSYDGLRQLPGIGDYTAGAIASFAYDMPYPAVDGNVYRVLARLSDTNTPIDSSAGKRFFYTLAKQWLDTAHPRRYNSAIMEFGALQCVPTDPDCTHCPLNGACLSYQHGTTSLLPVKKSRPSLRDRYLTYTIYIQRLGDSPSEWLTLIHQRNAKDIWQHLYEFPLYEGEQLQHTEAPHFDTVHILSHQRLHARFILQATKTLPSVEQCLTISLGELDNYAFSRLTLKALEHFRLR